jgi:hypothetical protein
MSDTKIVTIQKAIPHPLEDVFNIEPGTTIYERDERVTESTVIPENYDDKDDEIDQSIQEIYDKALSSYDNIMDQVEDAEPRLVPVLMQTGAQHLKVALDAAKIKARVKESKDKLQAKEKTSGPKTVNNNLIMSREDLMKMLDGNAEEQDK